MINRIHNHKIDLYRVIIFALLIGGYWVYLSFEQDTWLSLHHLLDYTEVHRILSYFLLVVACISSLVYLSCFLPIIKYMFFKMPIPKKGIIKKVKSKSTGILHARYTFEITIEHEGKEYYSEKVFAYIFNDSKINYGDVSNLWIGKEIIFYTSLINKQKAFIKRIIE